MLRAKSSVRFVLRCSQSNVRNKRNFSGLSKFLDQTTLRASSAQFEELKIPERISAIESLIHAPKSELQRLVIKMLFAALND
jgi:hypothetical protein